MTHGTPKDGDFARMVERSPAPPAAPATPQGLIADRDALLQVEVDRVLLETLQRTSEELDQIEALEQLPPLSDEELTRQAEAAPGADGDPSTPE